MSFKILIDNEEVVSNSNLQIKEEMLSTSSTILKNCYPKSWEEDKDYVSRYFFPKDYSKCKILDDTYHPYIPGITEKNTNFHFNYDTTKQWQLNGLFGNSSQTGTPTPSSPVDIQCVTGNQEVNICGKNLLNTFVDYQAEYSTTINGITFTLNSDGSITANGTASKNAIFKLYGSWSGTTIYQKLDTTKTYKISGADGTNAQIFIRTLTDGTYKTYNATSISTISSEESIVLFQVQVNSGTTVNNYVIKPQLEKGSTATEYEPYTGNTYEVNLGKNLLNASQESYTLPANENNSQLLGKIYLEKDVKYYISYDIENDSTSNTRSTPYLQIGGGNRIYQDAGTNKNLTKGRKVWEYTPTQSAIYNVGYWLHTSNIAVSVSNFMISISSDTTFTPYFTPIELNKIGTYEDYIAKTSGKNIAKVENTYITGADYSLKIINSLIDISSNSSNNAFDLSGGIRTGDYLPYYDEANDYHITTPNKQTYTISLFNLDVNVNGYSSGMLCIMTNQRRLQLNIEPNGEFIGDKTFTLQTNEYIKSLYFWTISSNTTTSYKFGIQIEEGSTSTKPEPYGNMWYICKNTRKLELAIADMNNNENYPGWKNVPYIKEDYEDINNGLNNVGINYYSNICIQQERDYVSFNTRNNNSTLFLGMPAWGNDHTQTYWQTNYPNLVFTLVYGIKNSNIIPITNNDLLQELNYIYYANLKDGINNINVISANLPTPIEIHYNYKDAWTGEDVIFSGFIKNTGKISLNPREPHYVDLQILDFKDLLSTGETLNYVISNKTITEAINQVVSSISDYGFVVGNINLINPNEIIGAYSTLNKTAYDVFQYFADITQSRWSTRVIDENTIAIDFTDPTLMEEGTPIESTTEFYENNEISDISFSYSTNDYRNKQIITSDEVFGNIIQTETKIADGYTQSFMCDNKIGKITEITVNGTAATFITKSEEELGLSGDFIYQPGESNFTSSNTIATGGIIVISYYPIVKGREIVINPSEISRINEQTNRKGTISRYENRNDSTTSSELIKIGQSYIKYKGQAEITLKVITTKDLWNVGQIVNYDAPLEELSLDYMVKSKQIDMYLNANKIFYTYQLTSNFNYENAINYFDNQRAKNQGNIGEGETITRNIDLTSEALIKFYETNAEEISIGTNTTLDFQLDSVII